MRFYPVTTAAADEAVLREEYKNARPIGVLRVGDSALFFRARLKTWYIPFTDITRCFRRVELVRATMCCGKGNMQMENLVVCGEGDRELAQIQLPGTRAAKGVMEELKEKLPEGTLFVCPPKAEE
ncbi:MAG: hypothetical protein K6C06_09990 [Lachnospiraceae bacterium]|nr:hypothetical protein [Lachnospiraceae bacterium]